jgi:DNA repair protein RadC
MLHKQTLPHNDLPRERLFSLGADALADHELLSIVLGFGGKGVPVGEISRRLLKTYGSLGALLHSTSNELLANKYIGESKTATLLAVKEISLRIMMPSLHQNKLQINSPKQVFECMRKDFFMKKRESLYLLSLNSNNILLHKDLLSVGTINATLISPREIFRQALLRNATSVILSHNHPSNNPSPSREDLVLTEEVALVGQKLGIKLLDHVIVCDHEFCSIKSLDVFTLNSKGGENDDIIS